MINDTHRLIDDKKYWVQTFVVKFLLRMHWKQVFLSMKYEANF